MHHMIIQLFFKCPILLIDIHVVVLMEIIPNVNIRVAIQVYIRHTNTQTRIRSQSYVYLPVS